MAAAARSYECGRTRGEVGRSGIAASGQRLRRAAGSRRSGSCGRRRTGADAAGAAADCARLDFRSSVRDAAGREQPRVRRIEADGGVDRRSPAQTLGEGRGTQRVLSAPRKPLEGAPRRTRRPPEGGQIANDGGMHLDARARGGHRLGQICRPDRRAALARLVEAEARAHRQAPRNAVYPAHLSARTEHRQQVGLPRSPASQHDQVRCRGQVAARRIRGGGARCARDRLDAHPPDAERNHGTRRHRAEAAL
ncbi:hypothetical protein ABIF05_000335 [Bradyrhizobium elkanii]